MVHYESTISSSFSFCKRSSGIAEDPSRSHHSGRIVQTKPAHMGTGCGIQHRRCQQDREFALHQRSQMGKAISSRWLGGTSRSAAPGKTENAHRRCRTGGYRNRHLAPQGSWVGLYHLVFGETRKTSARTFWPQTYQQGNDTSYSCASRTEFSYWTNMVRKQRSRIRGKKNAIVGIYRKRPRWGHVVCFDEMGPLQTIPRGGQAWGKRPYLRPDRYKRNGTLQWLCAFSPHTGQAVGKGYRSRDAETCKRFWEEHMLSSWPKGTIHLVMDNLSAHKKALRELPSRIRRRLRVYWTPTNSSWLNLAESYFATLQRTALHNTHCKTPDEIEQALLDGVEYLNENPRPYKWKKT